MCFFAIAIYIYILAGVCVQYAFNMAHLLQTQHDNNQLVFECGA